MRKSSNFSWKRRKLRIKRWRALDLIRPDPISHARNFWTNLENIWSIATKAIATIAVTVPLALTLAVLYHAVTKKIISIEQISVPDELSKSGLNSVVAARRLEKSIHMIFQAAKTSKRAADIMTQDEISKVVVPSTGLSVETIAASLRSFFRNESRTNVSGDITLEDAKLRLRLNLNGYEVYLSKAGVSVDGLSTLFDEGARQILRYSDPYVLASSISRERPDEAFDLARLIVFEKSGRKEDVPWAFNLMGKIRRDQNDLDGAIAYYVQALKIDRRFDMALQNLCLAYSDRGVRNSDSAEFANAIPYCEAAIELHPDAPGPRAALCHVYLARSEADTSNPACLAAIQKYQLHLSVNAFDVQARVKFGILLRDLHMYEDALKAFEQVANLDPHDARNHVDAGITLLALHKIDEAGDQFVAASDNDPLLKSAHSNLAEVLRLYGYPYASEEEKKLAAKGHN